MYPILKVGGVDVRGQSADQARTLLRGAPASSVKVRFERDALRPTADPNPEDLTALTEVPYEGPTATSTAAKQKKAPRVFDVELPRTSVSACPCAGLEAIFYWNGR